MNEGWATFWHYTLINDLYDLGYINDGFAIEALKNHTDVIHQLPFDHKFYSGMNPYTLGFHMFMDIKRICTNPTEEDKQWFPELAGSDWIIALDEAMRNYKDESFIRQYLSPHLIRELKLFTILDNEKNAELEITAIHDESGYMSIRNTLADQYTMCNIDPNIEVYNIDIKNSRVLTLRHTQFKQHPLDDKTTEMLKHVHRIWGFDIILESFCPERNEITKIYYFPNKTPSL